MIEKLYKFNTEDVNSVERIVNTNGLRINHLGLIKGEIVTPHVTEEAAHMIITHGILTLKLDDQDPKEFPAGSIIEIPAKTLLGISNFGSTTMHLFVIKKD
ncbi:MAG: hypothetical protein WDA17_01760 [Sphaerochaetaceae bacterium]